ncbi:GNAT family N-acetyltransferase [Paenibacillus oenotherae]|uniref:GNAT family N-acetyltransferase n=1 Tax=Paenibacillus oenotherae TaxID=1435645 RepID=A0ABS7DAZ1_9BACL|nr:GNAT family N-acetyltransferase [Paenibacillus oenotherae]MBW7477092.1 GNAT family N-acetyltransferase [Paenibacillus oenotherae]
MEWKHDSLPYRISDDKQLLDLNMIHTLLQSSYWASERSIERTKESIAGSLCYGIFDESGQIGFMRVVTDRATISWICDVIIHPDHRGKGLGKWLMQYLLEHPDVRHTNMLLGTRDAHGLYEQFGFERREMMRRTVVSH